MQAIKITILSIMSYSIMGCGASKVATSTQSSGTNLGAKLYADCSGFQKQTLGTQGVVSTFMNGSSYVPDLIRVKLTQINSAVLTSANDFIQFYRWSETNGTRSYNNTAASIVVQLKSSGNYLNNGAPWDRISKANIENMITGQNLSAQGITTANFNTHVIFILAGMDVQYQAMSLAFYNGTASGTAAYDSIDVLLPSFDANPNTYAQTRGTSSILPALHPNWAARNSGLSNQQFKDATSTYCSQF